jgi:rod shape-determining protein MreC
MEAFAPVTTPIYHGALRLKELVSAFQHPALLLRDNEALRDEVRTLLAERAELAEIESQNSDLRQALRLPLRQQYDLFSAEVQAADPLLFPGEILIRFDQALYLPAGLAVVSHAGALVGRLQEETVSESARVKLVTDPNFALPVRTGRGVLGLVRGVGGVGVVLDLVPRDQKLERDEVILTVGARGDIPGGLLVGKVGEILSQDADLFQKAQVNLAADLDQLRFVFTVSPQRR